MRAWLQVLGAFLVRDWRIQSRYAISLLMLVAQNFFLATTFFFIAKLVGPHAAPLLASYGGNYFAFVLLGLAFSQYVTTGLSTLSNNLREEQVQGTLEAMLLTPASLWSLVSGSVVWQFLFTTLEVVSYLAIGAFVFGLDLSHANLAAGFVIFVLLVGTMASLGVLSASGMLLLKEADPVNWMLGGMMKLLGGVYFPVAILPSWLQRLAQCFPLTYGLEGLRQAVLTGRSLSDLSGICLALAGFAVVLWLLAWKTLTWTLARLKETGALSFR